MTIRGIQSSYLSYSDGAVTTGTDTTAVQASEQATKERKLYGISLSSTVSDFPASAGVMNSEWILDIQVGFNSQANASGVLCKLNNAISSSLQGNVTPNEFITQGSKNIDIEFNEAIIWPEGGTISLIAHIFTDGNTCQMEGNAILRWSD